MDVDVTSKVYMLTCVHSSSECYCVYITASCTYGVLICVRRIATLPHSLVDLKYIL